VETVRARVAPGLTGRRFVGVEIDDARPTRPFEPRAVAAALEGETVAAVERRGKYLVVRFESGRSLLIHLRMTGSLLHAERGTLADDPHRRAVVRLDDGSDVAYRDVRRFGTWLLVEPEELEPYLATRLGGEPLERGFGAGIARQGSTLRDDSTPDGGRGRMQHEFKAYGRDGEPCDRCGTPIEKTRIAGRGTWYCPHCQPAGSDYAARRSSSRPSRSS